MSPNDTLEKKDVVVEKPIKAEQPVAQTHVQPGKENQEFPLPVAEDYDKLVADADKMAEIIDKHLDFESRLQGRALWPLTLCPEQKVSLASDLGSVL